jgi:oligopeptide/dipeptide ABC transporter ATP-binding protein
MPDNTKNSFAINIENLKVYFPVIKGILGKTVGWIKAVDDVSFTINKNQTFAIVGESGSGKTTIAHSIARLIKKTSGIIKFAIGPWKDSPISQDDIKSKDIKKLRQNIQIIFQDPFSSLNPRMTVKTILEEPLIIHKKMNKKERIEYIYELLNNVGLSKDFINRYPHEFSGGQRQRIGIARALACKPEVIIADEPVSALDVSIRAQIINLLQDLKEKYNQTLIIISHDLAVVRHMANSIAVMYNGKIMELGSNDDIFNTPYHPYTKTLLESIPIAGKGRIKKANYQIDEKNIFANVNGCPFANRCDKSTPECKNELPLLKNLNNNHFVACHLFK